MKTVDMDHEVVVFEGDEKQVWLRSVSVFRAHHLARLGENSLGPLAAVGPACAAAPAQWLPNTAVLEWASNCEILDF